MTLELWFLLLMIQIGVGFVISLTSFLVLQRWDLYKSRMAIHRRMMEIEYYI